MELYCEDAEICGYADDTSITVKANTLASVKDKCEAEVKNMLEYMALNRLSCNDDKTNILVMKNGYVNETLTFNRETGKFHKQNFKCVMFGSMENFKF